MPTLNEMQLDARSKGIGGSDVPVILGAVNYKTSVQLWLEKRGVEKPADISDQMNVRMGHLLEPIVVELFEREFAEETGQEIKTRKQNQPRTHKDHPFMVANIDRDIVGQRAGFEAKAFSPFARDDWGESGTSDVPLAVTAQCAHYMEVYGYDRWFVGVLLGIHDFRWYCLEREQDTIDKLIALEAQFWQCVEESTMPQILNADDVARLYPRGEGIVRANDGIIELLFDLADAREDLSNAKTKREKLEFEIKKYMRPHGSLYPVEGGTKPLVTWNHTKDRSQTDWKAVLNDLVKPYGIDQEELAELVEKHTTVTTPGPRSFLFKDKAVDALRDGKPL